MKLGIIGGAGPLASALFYETLVLKSYLLKKAMPEIFLLNYPFERGLTLKEEKDNGPFLLETLASCVNRLEAFGADIGILVCNTLHLKLAELPSKKVQFLPLPSLVLDKASHCKRLLFLGSANAARSSLYESKNLEIVYPSKELQKVVNGVIDNLLKGVVRREDSLQLEKVIETFNEVDGVILGCTDIPVLHHHYPIRSKVALFDSVKIPAEIVVRLL